MIKRYLQKYTGYFRSIKLIYFLNNIFSKKKLLHNKELYKKFGINKSIYSSLGAKDFDIRSKNVPWIDQDKALEKLNHKDDFLEFSPEIQKQIINFIEEGFMVLKSHYPLEMIEKHNEIVSELKASNVIDFNYTNKKINQIHQHSSFIDRSFFRDKNLLKLFNFLMGKEIIPFHTIHFLEGSEQRAHSDSIHMSTEPEGYLIASWTALEATDQNNGPLFYYPGSHRLPYISCLDYKSGNSKWRIGGRYRKYEDKIQEIISTQNFDKKYFYADPGDVLIWHANLLHGGDSIKETNRTRKSMVAHYFCEDVVCYHEITQRPAFLSPE